MYVLYAYQLNIEKALIARSCSRYFFNHTQIYIYIYKYICVCIYVRRP